MSLWEKIKELNHTPDYSGEFTKEEISANTVMAVLCYLNFLFLIPLLFCRESGYVRFHCNQGIVLLLCSILGGIILSFTHIGFLTNLWSSLMTILLILGLINVATNKAKELPVIGKFRIIK